MPGSIDSVLPPSAGEAIATGGGNRAFANVFNDYRHISDPNLRRRLALAEIDKVPLGLYHVRAVLVAGVGFFLDSYDIFAINLVTTLIGVVYWSNTDEGADGDNDGHLPQSVNQALKASTSGGIVIGMILFGWLADVFGRRKIYGVELIIIVACTLSCALVSSSPSISAAGLLIFWRVMMGIGIGGDYPLSSVITSEFAPTRWRGAMVSAVFSMQGAGQLASSLVALVTTVAFKDSFLSATNEAACNYQCRVAADQAWRIIIGVGAIPACFALYYRVTIPETPRYTFDVDYDLEKGDADIKAYVARRSKGSFDEVQRAKVRRRAGDERGGLAVPKASWTDLWRYFSEWKNLRILIGTTMSWFLLDLAFYGLQLNSTIVLHATGYGGGPTLYSKLRNNAVGLIVLTCAGSIPGYWTAVFLIDTIGRKPLQLAGFALLTIIFLILGFAFQHLSEGAFLALYIVGHFLFNAGPNTTTFVIPGECFPTRYRATAHGLSAAMGKIGAIVAQLIGLPFLNYSAASDCRGAECSPELHKLLKLFALFMFLGIFTTMLVPETKGNTLEELAGEMRTSYNTDLDDGNERPESSVWNPFAGGRPAGFSYPRSRAGFLRRRREQHQRVGIMTSPEMLAQNLREQEEEAQRRKQNRKKLWPGKKKKNRDTGSSGEAFALSSRHSSGGGSSVTHAERTSFVSPADEAAPEWGAGWGRVDRTAPVQSAQLRDVGALLQP